MAVLETLYTMLRLEHESSKRDWFCEKTGGGGGECYRPFSRVYVEIRVFKCKKEKLL